MPPKTRGRPKKQTNDVATPGSNTANTTSSPSTETRGTRASASVKGKGKAANKNVVPDVYRDMLAEALPSQSEIPERPLKKRKVGPRGIAAPRAGPSTSSPKQPSVTESHNPDEDEDVEFEDVFAPQVLDDEELDDEELGRPQQTAYRDSDEETAESDIDWENINFDNKDDEPSGDLELNLTASSVPQTRPTAPRRKAITQADKILRLEIHKLHILCLLSHVDRRNEWCNDSTVHDMLKPLLTKKMLSFLRPRQDMSQFSQTDAFKRGLDLAAVMWRTQFEVTRRGMRRALWADDEEHIKNYTLPEDADAAYEQADFRKAAKELKGSRDVGAQLFCALMRSAGVETRLVCSLQPLSFTTGGPPMPKPIKPRPKTPAKTLDTERPAISPDTETTESLLANPRRRLGHPGASSYHLPPLPAPPPPPKPKPKHIHESPYPIFWVEVLDVAHQKWIPVDPLVTETIARPRNFEPPSTDRENLMSYVIAFSADSAACDVTRRYVKAPNSKTRKLRIECTPGGQKWWNRTMRHFSRGWKTDAELIEDGELAALEAREPMPKNVQDFKDHPVYALERHLKRNEVIVAERESGRVATGKDNTAPGGKKLENVYRRKDVKIVRSADAWYRLGREVKMGEIPTKVVAARKKPDDFDGDDEGGEERAGTNLYTEDQTELYVPPPIVNGRVPKNSFGNIDVYVPSMVPSGGAHIPHPEAALAARLLGIDYAAALTGFAFKGRHGTAVLRGVVVAGEYREAVEAVVEGFRDEREREEEERREERVLGLWRRFLVGLRIKERVDGYIVEGEERDHEKGVEDDGEVEEENEEAEGDSDGGSDEDNGGGFVRDDSESELSDTYVDDDDDMAGGFFPE
ncbi:hypothetical protein CJF32_00010257 [Rutstroemia sp. NJR-2017a WRK4]|nr:hypothetical protein CJF32_00010257 [Rutstroemia sp. NJR-2017a WRK4]